ncbi:hypothetical protein PPTG_20690 [Phytophthora nicotianae INRA-310]|uniref:Uncharacterized protein n=2 Tax=Phytophthora nicotianae TaxID=4792 RepID=W2RG93_PHYN3|nr:hypothetical protein PPTG_20690 [Phytophthora nicotianae INRA-310]ETN23684.1 hypothetical protein PPTG_20690 [Phytophthora nicotianae INRA-310]
MEKIADEFSKTIQYSLEKSSEVSHIVGSAMFASVFNMDQSAVYIDMNPNTTIDFVGAKHIDVVQGMTENALHLLLFSVRPPSGRSSNR